MKTIYSLLIICLVILSAASCRKEKTKYVTGDYLIVGRHGGMVPPETRARFFIVANGKMALDTNCMMMNRPGEFHAFKFDCDMQDVHYKKVADLPGAIPVELLSLNEQNIGTPLMSDGIIDVRTVVRGRPYRWLFETSQRGLSPEIQEFARRLREGFDIPAP